MSRILVPFALCAMGMWCVFWSGCKREEGASEPPRGTMPTLKETGAKPSAAAIDATAAYEKLVDAKRAYVEKTGERIGSDDPEKVRAALAGDAGWKKLEEELNIARAQLEKIRAAAGGKISK